LLIVQVIQSDKRTKCSIYCPQHHLSRRRSLEQYITSLLVYRIKCRRVFVVQKLEMYNHCLNCHYYITVTLAISNPLSVSLNHCLGFHFLARPSSV